MPVVVPLAIDLASLLVCLIALAVCLAVVYFARAFFGTLSGAVGWIPLVGSVASRSITFIEHKITSIMGIAVQKLEAAVGLFWHGSARLLDWLGREIAGHAHLLATLGQLMVTLAPATIVYRLIRGVLAQVRVLQHRADAALHRLEIATKRLEHGIGEDVLPRVKSLEGDLSHVIGKELGAIRARERELERGGAHVWKWIRAHPNALASTAFAGAVAWALARLGAGWVRCGNWRKIGRGVCATPAGEIDALLGLFAAGATIASFRELVKLGQQVEHGVATVLQDVAKL